MESSSSSSTASSMQFTRRVKRGMHAVMLLLVMVASAVLLLLRQSSPFDLLSHSAAAGSEVDNNKKNSDVSSGSGTDGVEWEFMPQTDEEAPRPPLEALQQQLSNKTTGSSEQQVTCDHTVGEWVLGETNSRPFYSGRQCSRFLSPDWACRLRNHTNLLMDRYRWQPAGCDLPLFNASAALELLRNKVIAFVGDSLGRQQYQSLLCMLTHGNNSTPITTATSRFGFHTPPGSRRPTGWADTILSTNTTIVYKWSVTLSHSSPLPNSNSTALHIDCPEPFLVDHFHNFDILVLNSGHHWSKAKLMDQYGYLFYSNGSPSELLSVAEAYNRSMHNVARWVDKQLTSSNSSSTKRVAVYYRSLSPKHFGNGDWNSGGRCDDARFGEVLDGVMERDVIGESAVRGTSLRFLNVTGMSAVRGEAHVGKFRRSSVQSAGVQDCVHWCLPGVPDAWNEIMLADLARLR